MNDERKINVAIGEFILPMTVRTEKEEEIARKAASRVSGILNTYRTKYPQESREKIFAMVALHTYCKAMLLEEKNDTEPFKKKLKELTRDMEEFLKKD